MGRGWIEHGRAVGPWRNCPSLISLIHGQTRMGQIIPLVTKQRPQKFGTSRPLIRTPYYSTVRDPTTQDRGEVRNVKHVLFLGTVRRTHPSRIQSPFRSDWMSGWIRGMFRWCISNARVCVDILYCTKYSRLSIKNEQGPKTAACRCRSSATRQSDDLDLKISVHSVPKGVSRDPGKATLDRQPHLITRHR